MNVNYNICQKGLIFGKPSDIYLGHNDDLNPDYVNWMYVREVFVRDKYFIYEGSKYCIYVINMYTKKHISVLQGHIWSIENVILKDDILISCSLDRTIKIWNIISGECIRTLRGHKCYVSDIILRDDIIYSCSTDKTIKMWDYDSGICLKTIAHKNLEHPSEIFIKDNLLICNGGYKILILDILNNDFIATLSGHKNVIQTMYLNGDELVTTSQDKTLKIWDMKTYKCYHTIVCPNTDYNSIMYKTKDNLVFSSSRIGKNVKIKICDIEEKYERNIIYHDCYGLGYLYVTNNTIITRVSNDIKFWDITTGECIKKINGYKLLIHGNKMTVVSQHANGDTYLTITPIITEDIKELDIFKKCIDDYCINEYLMREIMLYFNE